MKLRPTSKAAKFLRRMQCEQCHHEPISELICAGELGHGPRVFSLLDQRQTGFDVDFGEHETVELRARLRHEGEIFVDLGEPGEVVTRGYVLGDPAQIGDRAIKRRRGDTVLKLGDVGTDLLRDDVCGSRSISLKPTAAVEETKKVSVIGAVGIARDRLKVPSSTASLGPLRRLASRSPGPAIGLGPQVKWQGTRLSI
jgi:hypothetical protein